MFLSRLLANHLAMVGAVIIAVLTIGAVIAPLIATESPDAMPLESQYLAPSGITHSAPMTSAAMFLAESFMAREFRSVSELSR